MARVVVGVGGSIAAWKACDVVSKLVQEGHVVDVVMTRMAQRFLRPLTFSALTHRRVFTDAAWGRGSMPHDHLVATREAEALVVAPCTANLVAKFAHGLADDILSTTWLAADCPRLVAPAMNQRMWRHPRVQANVRVLEEDDVAFVGPGTGWLAEAEEGPGRMAEPPEVLEALRGLLRARSRGSGGG